MTYIYVAGMAVADDRLDPGSEILGVFSTAEAAWAVASREALRTGFVTRHKLDEFDYGDDEPRRDGGRATARRKGGVAMNVLIEGDCAVDKGRVNYGYGVPTCSRGTYGCTLAHRVRREGTRCTICHTEGGYYTCPESDRMAFTCSNYAGLPESVLG